MLTVISNYLLIKKADELEESACKGNIMCLFKNYRELSERKPPKTGVVRSKSGKVLENESIQLERYKEYFAKLLNADRVDVDPELLSSAEHRTCDNHPKPDPPSVEYIQKTPRKMKNNKGAGSVGSPSSSLDSEDQ